MSVVRMLEATVIGRSADAEATLTAIQAAGLLHITPMRPPAPLRAAEGGEGLLDRVAKLRRARAAIASRAAVPSAVEPMEPDALADRVCAELDRRVGLESRRNAVEATVRALAPWGELDPADLDMLAERGAPVTFVRLTPADFRMLDWSRVTYAVAHRTDDEVYVAIFSQGPSELPATPIRLPRVRLSTARAELAELVAELRGIDHLLGSLVQRLPALDERLAELADQAAVLEAIGGGLDEGALYAVSGFVPAENQSDLERAILPFAAVLRVQDPAAGEPVPVKLRHAAPVAGFGAIVRSFSGISYWEKDFTPIVMMLFMVFGALCLIDAGYGLLLLLTGGALYARGQRDFGGVFLWTGAFSLLVGALGGQYFGLIIGRDVLVGQAPPTPLAADPMSTFLFSLAVGMATMAVAYATAIWQRGWRTVATGSLLVACGAIAVAVGWYGADRVASLLVASPDPAQVAQLGAAAEVGGGALIVGGVLAWLLFPDPVFGPRSHVANVLWTLYAGLTGLGQDVMSHMRLFGISLSGAIMASVINTMAGMLPLPGAVLVAVVGHGFVFLLALLSLYIHTNRLIFLEFGSKCFDGGQAWYEPLRSRLAARRQTS